MSIEQIMRLEEEISEFVNEQNRNNQSTSDSMQILAEIIERMLNEEEFKKLAFHLEAILMHNSRSKEIPAAQFVEGVGIVLSNEAKETLGECTSAVNHDKLRHGKNNPNHTKNIIDKLGL